MVVGFAVPGLDLIYKPMVVASLPASVDAALARSGRKVGLVVLGCHAMAVGPEVAWVAPRLVVAPSSSPPIMGIDGTEPLVGSASTVASASS